MKIWYQYKMRHWNVTASPSESGSIFQDFLHSTQEHAENSFLDLFVSMDRGGQGAGEHLKRIVLLATREPLDLGYVIGREDGSHFLEEGEDVSGEEDSTEGAVGVSPMFGGQAAVVADHLHPVPRL